MERRMWDAYVKQAGGVTFDGKPLPAWEELGDDRQACWMAAAKVVDDEIERLRQQNAELIKVLQTIASQDADAVTIDEFYSMSQKDCYELGKINGKIAMRDAVENAAWAAIAEATGDE